MGAMRDVLKVRLGKAQACLWFLGQAGYVARSSGVTLVVDPYLSDSVGKASPDFSRAFPVPLAPEDLEVDVFVVTHDHLDHLDPETVGAYRHKKDTLFVAPRLAAKKLASLGVPKRNIRRIDSGENRRVRGVTISGVYAVPTSADAVDTTGYRLEFENGRSVYHSSDTAFSDVLICAAPRAEVLLVCINGKWGNLNVAEAAKLAAAAKPKVAIPNHYDLMARNSEDPEKFRAVMAKECPGVPVRILKVLEPFIW